MIIESAKKERSWTDWALRAIALVGLLAILVLGAWGIIELAFSLPDVLGGIGSGASSLFEKSPTATTTPAAAQPTAAQETVNVTAPSLATSGQAFMLSWAHTGSNPAIAYSYAISYSCESGLSLKAPLPTGALQVVPCNTPFNYTNATQNILLTPTVAGNKQISMSLTVAAVSLASNTATATGAATTTVLPSATVTGSYPTGSSSSAATSPASTYTPAKAVATLYGLPNLTATVVSATPTATGYSVEFLIKNTGTNTAGSGWAFTANVPVSAGYVYQAQPQRALNPGDSILYTMAFSLPAAQNYSYNAYAYTSTPACGYTQNYTYNGYANYPAGSTYTCNNTSNYQSGYPTQGSGGYVFSVTANPTGALAESTHNDNTASITF